MMSHRKMHIVFYVMMIFIIKSINQSINQSTFGLYTSLVVRKDREKLPLVLT